MQQQNANTEERIAKISESLVKSLNKKDNWDEIKDLLMDLKNLVSRGGNIRTDSNCVDLLLKALEYEKNSKYGILPADVRRKAADILGSIHAEVAIKSLCSGLSDEYSGSNAAEALGKIGGSEAVAALCKALRTLKGEDNCYTRGAAAKALGAIGDKSTTETLYESMIKDDDYTVKQIATISLGILGDRRAEAPLIRLLEKLTVDQIASAMEGFYIPDVVKGIYNAAGIRADILENLFQKICAALKINIQELNKKFSDAGSLVGKDLQSPEVRILLGSVISMGSIERMIKKQVVEVLSLLKDTDDQAVREVLVKYQVLKSI